ncbi:MAG: hypothetical protein KA419_01245 [Acidobacteria bacterium]|nr:hypothetical protein [Acidobacteriota bacterium]
MKPDPRLAFNRAVTKAARAWHEAGALSSDTLQAILARYPDGGPPDSVILTVAFFLLVTLGSLLLLAGTGALTFVALDRLEPAFPLILLGTVLCLDGDRLDRKSGLGKEGMVLAAQFWGALFLASGLVASLGWFNVERPSNLSGVSGLVVFGLAAWRWGRGLFTLLAVSAFFLQIHLSVGHPGAWFLGGLLLGAGSGFLRRGASATRRESGGILLLTSLVTIYAAVNRYVLEERWLFNPNASLHPRGPLAALADGPGPWYSLFSIAATVLFPLVLLAWGARSRRLSVLNAGLVCLVLSLATLYVYHPVLPLWVVFCLGGPLLAGLAWGLESGLNRRPGQEWHGFTAQPLYGNTARDRGLNLAAKVFKKHLPGW